MQITMTTLWQGRVGVGGTNRRQVAKLGTPKMH